MGTGLVVEGLEGRQDDGDQEGDGEPARARARSDLVDIGRVPPPLEEMRQTLRELRDGERDRNCWLFIHDLHYVEDEHCRHASSCPAMKAAGRSGAPARVKVTLIGINFRSGAAGGCHAGSGHAWFRSTGSTSRRTGRAAPRSPSWRLASASRSSSLRPSTPRHRRAPACRCVALARSPDGYVPLQEARLRFDARRCLRVVPQEQPYPLLPGAPDAAGPPVLPPRDYDADAGRSSAQVLPPRAEQGGSPRRAATAM